MLYYAVLGCNVPVYLHINLAQDNEYLIGFWWYASTCRHLGIGGTHQDLKIVESQKLAMKQYRKLERFYKRGEFFGISEEIHLHVIPDENVFMVNVFNISDTKRTVSGSIELQKIGVDPRYIYNINKKEGTIKNGIFNVACDMEPWSTQLIEVAATNIPQQIKPGQ